LQSCTAIRAGVSGYRETDFFHDIEPLEPVIGAAVPKTWSRDEESVDRVVAMAADAITECLTTVDTGSAPPLLLLGWRESHRAELEITGGANILRVIQDRVGVRFHPRSGIIPSGNAAAFMGLSIAAELIESGAAPLCLVGGVDSYLNTFDITYYESNFRLLGPAVARGFVPGEGAAFVAVTDERRLSAAASLAICGVGVAQEDADVTALSDGHPTGRGMVRALQAAESNSGICESQIAFRISDLNGESYRGIESMLAQSRFYRTRRERLDIWHPADCIGETGAGVGALLLIVAEHAMRKGYAPGTTAMCECSADAGLRTACLVEAALE
jgi:3-oxoacyl-[acyl-carrier-protein] synthase-1